jgi:hypothetical protein
MPNAAGDAAAAAAAAAAAGRLLLLLPAGCGQNGLVKVERSSSS